MRSPDFHREKHVKQRLERPLPGTLDEERDFRRPLQPLHRKKRSSSSSHHPQDGGNGTTDATTTQPSTSRTPVISSPLQPPHATSEQSTRPRVITSTLPALGNAVLPQEFSLPGAD